MNVQSVHYLGSIDGDIGYPVFLLVESILIGHGFLLSFYLGLLH